MTLHDEQERVQKAVNNSLSYVQEDPWLTQRVLAQAKGEEPVKKKLSASAILVIVLITVSVTAALAAGIISLNRTLEDRLQVTDDITTAYENTDLINTPLLAAENNGITVILDQCVVDNNCAYIAFQVKGYRPAAGVRPSFEDVMIRVDGFQETDINWNFAYYDYEHKDEESDSEGDELTFIANVLLFDQDKSLIGQKMNITLKNIGAYVVDPSRPEQGLTFNQDVEGVWNFGWVLKGTDMHLDLTDLALPIGGTGSVLTSLHLSPISVRMQMTVPREPVSEDPMEDNAPYFYGLKYQDGTELSELGNGGGEGYESKDSEVYMQFWNLDRVIDLNQVSSILFVNPFGENELIEVRIN